MTDRKFMLMGLDFAVGPAVSKNFFRPPPPHLRDSMFHRQFLLRFFGAIGRVSGSHVFRWRIHTGDYTDVIDLVWSTIRAHVAELNSIPAHRLETFGKSNEYAVAPDVVFAAVGFLGNTEHVKIVVVAIVVD